VRLCLDDDPRGFALLAGLAEDPIGRPYAGFYGTLAARRQDDMVLAAG
jgi:hypothetical protein